MAPVRAGLRTGLWCAAAVGWLSLALVCQEPLQQQQKKVVPIAA